MRKYLESRPLLALTVAYLAGLAAGPFACLTLAGLMILRSRRAILYALVLGGACFGWMRGIEPEPSTIPPKETTLEGRVLDDPVQTSTHRQDLSADSDGSFPSRTTFELATSMGKIKVYRRGETDSFFRGDTIKITGLLSSPRGPSNPGQHDFARQLRRRGIVAILRSYEKQECVVQPGWHILRPVDQFRSRLREQYYENTDPETAGLLSALVLGFRDGLPQPLVTHLRRSGTAHFLAISGLHLGLVFGLVLGVTLLFRLRGPKQTWTVLLVLFGYTLLTGMNIAVLRAFVMIAILLLGRLLHRKRDAITSLAAAALLITFFDPFSIHEISFQLSFLAVLGIFWIGPVFHDFVGNPFRLGSAVAVSLSAWLATAPVLQNTFHLVTPLIVVANLILWPFIAILIALGLLLLLFSWTPLAPWLGAVAGQVMAGLQSISGGAETLAPFSYFHSPGTGFALLLVYYTVLMAWTVWARRSQGAFRAVMVVPIVLLLTVPLLQRKKVEHPFVAQLDVGRGLCTYVEFPDGRNFVFDVGSLDYRDAGASVLAPYLWSRGVREIDTVFLSHADADHHNGLPGLLSRFPVRQIVMTPDVRLPAIPENMEVRRVRVTGDQPLPFSKEIAILSPPVWEEVGRPVASNETSLVLRVGDHLLLTGDIMDQATEKLLSRSWDLRSTVLMAPHHGKRFKLHRELARRTGAKFLIVSGPEGYHADEVVEAFPGAVYSTGRWGAVEIELTTPPRITTFQP